jgi:outer membrane protein assembly factor BamB
MIRRHLSAFAVAMVLVLGAAVPATATSSAWPQFGGSWTHAGFSDGDTVLSTGNVGRLHVAWSVKLPDGVFGSVAAAGGRLFAATWSGEVFALRASDGTRLWHRSLGMPAAKTTPAVWQNLVIVTGGSYLGSQVVAYDVATGAIRWKATFAGDLSMSGPTVAGDTIFTASTKGVEQGVVYALSAATGHIRWSRNLASEIDGPLAVSAGQAYVYAAGLDGMVYGLSSTSGKVVWQVQAGGGIFSGGPAVKYGIVYVAQGRSGAEGGGFQTVAMQATDGLILWRSDSGDDVHVTPSVGGDATYLGAIDGTLTSLDAHTGALRWIADLGAETWSSAALANGVVYIDTESRFYALRASTGAVLFAYSMPTSFAGMSSPSVAYGRVYIGNPDGGVIAFALK